MEMKELKVVAEAVVMSGHQSIEHDIKSKHFLLIAITLPSNSLSPQLSESYHHLFTGSLI